MDKRKIFVPLTIARPEVAAEWHPTLNGDVSADSVGVGSHYKAWWRCGRDESIVFQRDVSERCQRGCPYCAKAPKSLFTRFPQIAKQLHKTKNGDLNPLYLAAKSKQLVWWQCEKNGEHVWEESAFDRTGRKSHCPFCKGARVSEDNTLAKNEPELASEWHPAKNGKLTPETITTHFYKKVWWICKLKHEWQAKVNVRISARSGCPFCSHKYLLKENTLAARFPEVAAQWHPTKNDKMLPALKGSFKTQMNRHLSPEDRPTMNRRLTPDDVSCTTQRKVWWQCPKGSEHVWQASVRDRTSGYGCPYCSHHKIDKQSSLAAKYPAISNQWHPTRNQTLHPDEVGPNSNKLVWWRCARSAKHVWQAVINEVVRSWKNGNNGCPFCSGKKVTNDSCLSARYPDVAKLWHPSLNGTTTPDMVTPFSGKMIYWQCTKSQDHVWSAIQNNVVNAHKKGRSGCPFCYGKKVSLESSLEKKYPDLAKSWHKKLNKPLEPHQVTSGSNKIVWWRCLVNESHIWQRKINNQLDTWKRGLSGCPECKVKST